MSRLKSDDPKVAVTIRVRQSVLARMGPDLKAARGVIEGLCETRYGAQGPLIKMQPLPALSADVIGFTASGEEIKRAAIVSRPKVGKR